MKSMPKIDNWLDIGFHSVHRNNLVYVTCWEDPRLDRVAMNLTKYDTVLVLTSGGCNALEYALDEPEHIYAVDVNPRQNALLELKIAGIRELDYSSFFKLFGEGHLANFNEVYPQQLRGYLSSFAQQYWDNHGSRLFAGKRSFFFHGTTGIFAQLINFYIDHVVQLRDEINALLKAKTIEEQSQIYYDEQLNDRFWKKFIRQMMNSNLTLWMLGVPPQQREQMERYLKNGVADFVEDCCQQVFSEIPIWDNYFWRVFLEGKYTPNCCPEYLKPENFQLLKAGLVDRISIHTDTVAQFLERNNDIRISHFVLLDHMDWLSNYKYTELQREWQAIVDRSEKKSRILFRSGGFQVEYVDPICVSIQGQEHNLGELLQYHKDLAKQLHQKDRVHTYGSFYIADLVKA
ncbi:MAG: BtaA family protein [Microcoleaceae cyanobacterium MO_207.B10]|nr:BtaA family protein [Microcoleaceae cyanobacterium MO_207.B10]